MLRMSPVLALVLVAGAALPALAQSINVDVNRTSGAGTGVPAPSFVGVAGQAGTWNNLTPGSSGTINLIGLDGAASGLTLTRSGIGGEKSSSVPNGSADFGKLFWDYGYSPFPQSEIVYTVNGLDEGTYRLITYACLPGDEGWYLFAGQFKTFYKNSINVYVAGQNKGGGTTEGEVLPNTYAKGVTHVVTAVKIGPGAPALKISSSTSLNDPNHQHAAFNGFQLVKYTGSRLYVDGSALGLNNGKDWSNAFKDLQDALQLAAASEGQISEIWVANGTYYPTASNRNASFVLPSGVKLYGGFAGGESQLDQRDPAANVARLSGDFMKTADRGDNSYHVIDATDTTSSTLIDGFTIVDGQADGFGDDVSGAAIYGSNARVRVHDCVIREHQAKADGGAVLLTDNASVAFVNTTFYNCYSVTYGGAIRNMTDSNFSATNCRFLFCGSDLNGGAINSTSEHASLVNCAFDGNFSGANGGAVYIFGAGTTATLANCTFWGNEAGQGPTSGKFGGLGVSSNAQVNAYNSIFYSNTDDDVGTPVEQGNAGAWNGGVITFMSNLVGGWSGAMGGSGNIGGNPAFIDANGNDGIKGNFDDNLRLAKGSPCVDAADNSKLPIDNQDLDGDLNIVETIPFDIDMTWRRVDDPFTSDTGVGNAPIVDMGAYEFKPAPCYADCDGSGELDVDDFICFQTHFGLGDLKADCDASGELDIDDFICFQTAFGIGCQ